MSKLQSPTSRLICLGSARALTNAGPGDTLLEFFPDDPYDGEG